MKSDTIAVEDEYFAPFFSRTRISIDRGEGVYVWDENGRKYLDFTSGWGVTCIGHANPVITKALIDQSMKIIHNPNSGLTYSPYRAKLLSLLTRIMPSNLTSVFFTNSGAESNDAAIKLARKVSGKLNVISALRSFHGRTMSTVSATGQSIHRNKYRPLMPNHVYVPFNNIEALEAVIRDNAAAFIVEPIQGEGGINVPSEGYLEKVSELCARNDVYLIIDEIQTGFCRTGRMFASAGKNIKIDFLTMAKGIAGGFPFGALAMSKEVSAKLEKGDHGGTYCGNPLGCSVSHAVISYLIDNDIGNHVEEIGAKTLTALKSWMVDFSAIISDVRGKGLLIGIEFRDAELTEFIRHECLMNGLILNVTQGKVIRIFPALTITHHEMEEGLEILKAAVKAANETYCCAAV